MRRLLLLAALGLAACGGEPRGPCDWDVPAGTVGTVCGFTNPEDVEFVPSASLLLVSQMRGEPGDAGGSIAALLLDAEGRPASAPRQLWPDGPPRGDGPTRGEPRCSHPPAAAAFSPHGLTAEPDGRGAVRVAVVAHGAPGAGGAREAVELFELRGAGQAARLVWRGCVRLPPDAVGNDVAWGPAGALYVTRYQPTLRGPRGLYWRVAGGLGFPTGEVQVWRPGAGWEAVPGTRAANPNGLLRGAGGETLFVAATGSGDLHAVRPATGERRSVSLGGRPDNLSRGPQGRLLAVAHRDGLAVTACLLGRRPCLAPWSLLAVDPETLAVRELLFHDGRALGGAASAAAVGGGRVYLGAVVGDRIGVWRPPADAASAVW